MLINAFKGSTNDLEVLTKKINDWIATNEDRGMEVVDQCVFLSQDASTLITAVWMEAQKPDWANEMED
jgi:hypothetical protein